MHAQQSACNAYDSQLRELTPSKPIGGVPDVDVSQLRAIINMDSDEAPMAGERTAS